jgi:hypothetical protein
MFAVLSDGSAPCLSTESGELQTAKGSAEKVALASFIRKGTMMTNGWLSKNLHMGDPSRESRYCCAAAGRPHIRKLVRKLKMSIGKA